MSAPNVPVQPTILIEERRRARRYDLHLRGVIICVDADSVQIPCDTLNVSSGGMLLLCDTEISGAVITCVLTLFAQRETGRPVLLNCKGVVVRRERQEQGMLGMGAFYKIALRIIEYEFVRPEGLGRLTRVRRD